MKSSHIELPFGFFAQRDLLGNLTHSIRSAHIACCCSHRSRLDSVSCRKRNFFLIFFLECKITLLITLRQRTSDVVMNVQRKNICILEEFLWSSTCLIVLLWSYLIMTTSWFPVRRVCTCWRELILLLSLVPGTGLFCANQSLDIELWVEKSYRFSLHLRGCLQCRARSLIRGSLSFEKQNNTFFIEFEFARRWMSKSHTKTKIRDWHKHQMTKT